MSTKRWLMTLLVVVLTALAGWRQGSAPAPKACSSPSALAASVVTPQEDRHHEATLTDASSLYRICTTRPQRVMPSHGNQSSRSYSPCGLARRLPTKPLQFRHDGRRRLETAPYCLSASCKYYVIALRHIIR